MDTVDTSKLLDYLPAIYREDPFLSRYLFAFEKLLLGRNDNVTIPGEKEGSETRSLEETIDSIPALFDPRDERVTQKDFLPWLASWVALSLRADLDDLEQRRFVANIVQRYRRRGTKGNLIELLTLFTRTTAEIDEDAVPNKDRFPQFEGERQLHFFKAIVWLSDPTPAIVQRKREIARAIIELEKPAHTFYELEIRFASMRIGDYSDRGKYHASVGVDTLINIWSNVHFSDRKAE